MRKNAAVSFLDVWKINAAYGCSAELGRMEAACVDVDPDCARLPQAACALAPSVRLLCQKLCSTCRPPPHLRDKARPKAASVKRDL